MRVAILSDIHGNALALDAVLADLEQSRLDHLLCLGDLATNGPQPVEVIERLQALKCLVVLGNTDADLLSPPRWYTDPAAPELPESAQHAFTISRWCREQLQPHHLEYLGTFPPTIQIDLGMECQLLAFHGSPRGSTEVIAATTSDSNLDEMLAGTAARVLAGGHTHVPLLRRHRERVLINPGSVGLPFERYGLMGQVRLLPEAQYALVTFDRANLAVEFKRVAIDIRGAIAAAFERDMPYAKWWADLWLS